MTNDHMPTNEPSPNVDPVSRFERRMERRMGRTGGVSGVAGPPGPRALATGCWPIVR